MSVHTSCTCFAQMRALEGPEGVEERGWVDNFKQVVEFFYDLAWEGQNARQRSAHCGGRYQLGGLDHIQDFRQVEQDDQFFADFGDAGDEVRVDGL